MRTYNQRLDEYVELNASDDMNHSQYSTAPYLNWILTSTRPMTPLERIRMGFFIQLTMVTVLVALFWGILCLCFGLLFPSLVPLTYILVSGLNIYLLEKAEKKDSIYAAQVGLSILLPFVFQHALGGMMQSGVVMIWAIVGLMGSVTFLKRAVLFKFFLVTIALFMLASAYETIILEGNGNNQVSFGLTSMNLTMVISVMFLKSVQFIKEQKTAFRKLRTQGKEIEERNQQIEKGLAIAAKLQRTNLPEGRHFMRRFKDHCIEHHPQEEISRCFYWLGSYYGKEIIVNMHGNWNGVQGVMLNLMAESFLKERIYESGVHEAEKILNDLSRHIEELLIKRMDVEVPSFSMNVMTFDWTSHELENAGSGYGVFIKQSMNDGYLNRQAKFGLKCEGAECLKDAQVHNMTVAADSQIVIYNDWLEEELSSNPMETRIKNLLSKWGKKDKTKLSELRSQFFSAFKTATEEGQAKDSILIALDLAIWDGF